MTQRFDSKRILVNTAVALYFIAMIVSTQMGGLLVSLLWYGSVTFGAVIALYSCDLKIERYKIVFMALTVITGVINMYFIGTTRIRDQVLIFFLMLLSMLFTSEYASENTFLFASVANILLVIFKFLTVGFHGQIYNASSTNFISVYLLYPTVMYYIKAERNNSKIALYPAAVIWILSLLSRGRGGIIATSILLLGIFIYVFKRTEDKWRILFIYGVILVAGVLAYNLDVIINKINSSVITEYFRHRGMKSIRTTIWSDYFDHTFASVKEIILGTDISKTFAGMYKMGNPHNSFLNIHMHNGLIMLIAVIGLLIKRTVDSIRSRNLIFTVCMLSMMFRAFTDSVFWPAYGSAVLFAFLFWETPAPKRRSAVKKSSCVQPDISTQNA